MSLWSMACLGTAAVCAVTALTRPVGPGPQGGARLWALVAVLLGWVGAMAWLGWDDQALQALRRMAWASGWYAWRRPMQAALLLALALGAWLVWREAGLGAWMRRQGAGAARAAVAAAWVVFGLWGLRAVSLHMLDGWLARPLPPMGLGLGRTVELGCLVLVWGALGWAWRTVGQEGNGHVR